MLHPRTRRVSLCAILIWIAPFSCAAEPVAAAVFTRPWIQHRTVPAPGPRPHPFRPSPITRLMWYWQLKLGPGDTALGTKLTDAETGLRAAFKRAASRASSDENKKRALECLGDALKASGESYVDAVRENSDAERPAPPPSPSLDDVTAGISDCLKRHVPAATARVHEQASEAVSLAVESVQDAAAAREARMQPAAARSFSSRVLAYWMIDSGSSLVPDADAIEQSVDAPPAPATESLDESDRGSPPWAIIIGALVLSPGIGLVLHKRHRSGGT
jgi:hypothetical protein